jgi:hypothetical protein
MSGSIELMKITGFTDQNYKSAFPGDPYTLMMNPDSINWQRKIDYNDQQVPDSSTASQKYKSTPCEKITFSFVIDCTGVVDPDRTNLATEINNLENIIFTYNGKIHRPNFVVLQWGKSLTFKGVLKSFDTNYTLFRPDGSPVRAKISLSFEQFISTTNVAKLENQQSPDISHYVNIKQGEHLPQLCQQIWGNPFKYIDVAKFNNLNKFRHIPRETSLIFPPIINSN